SFKRSDCPLWKLVASIPGPIATRIFRPLCNTSAVCLSTELTKTAKVAGGSPSSSIEACSSTIFSRAVASAWAKRSFRAVIRRSSLWRSSLPLLCDGCVTGLRLLHRWLCRCQRRFAPRTRLGCRVEFLAACDEFSYQILVFHPDPLDSTLNPRGRGRLWLGVGAAPLRGGRLPSAGRLTKIRCDQSCGVGAGRLGHQDASRVSGIPRRRVR